jgi:hypothetical protein
MGGEEAAMAAPNCGNFSLINARVLFYVDLSKNKSSFQLNSYILELLIPLSSGLCKL